jgi:hypothetical protein
MNGFIIQGDNKPGQIARVAEAIASKGINIATGACIAYGDKGGLGLVTNDQEGTRSALAGAGIEFREVELISFTVPDKPGSLADAARKLGDAGVNIELLVPTGMSGEGMVLAAGVDKPDVAREALSQYTAARA